MNAYILPFISSIVAIVICILSWYLVRVNINADLKRQEQRKINRLIAHLLELSYWVDKEIAFDTQIGEVLDAFEQEVHQQQAQITAEDFRGIREKIIEIIKGLLPGYSPLEELENNIKDTIKELAEIDPVLAFELTGKYQLTANTRRLQAFMDAAAEGAENAHLPGLVINDMLRPQMLKDLQNDLKINLPLIAQKSDKKTYQRVVTLSPAILPAINKNEVSQFLADFVPKLIQAQQQLPSSEL